MPLAKKLCLKEIEKIDFLRKKNLTIRQIAEKINRSKTVVGNYLKSPSTYGTTKRSGRKKKVSERLKRSIIRLASNKTISCSQIASDLNAKVSRWTINSVLKECEFLKYQKKKSSPPLANKHKENRLKWARKYMTWNQEWHNIVWSDEKRFNLDGPDGYSYYWHDLRKEQIFSKQRCNGGGSVMIWASFGALGKSEICFIDKRLNANGYREVLKNHLLHSGRKIGGPDWIFQQDNAPCHRAKASLAWFKSNKIKVLDWPSLSPDMNPIENLWSSLVRRVYSNGKQYNSIEELKRAITKSWSELPITEIKNLINSMPNRLFELIRLNGEKTKY
jgi:transposase